MTDFKLQKVIIILLIGLGAIVAVNRAMAPDDGRLTFKVQGELAYGYGTTSGASLGDFKQFIRENPEVTTLVLYKMPGTVDSATNLKLARLIRAKGLNTHLVKASAIASGAVDLFIAGAQRSMECGALIGVHSWSYRDNNSLVQGPRFHPGNLGSDPFQNEHERFLTDMGVDPAFYVFTREAALPDDIYYLKSSEIAQYGLLTEPAECDR